MDLTIIVPIYNVQDYLEECLTSIQAALMPSFSAEVLCVNDGSTDRSEQIATLFCAKDNRFKFVTQVNGGYGKAINSGMKNAQGRFVTIVESDDLILPSAYPALLRLLQDDDTLDFVKTPYQPFTVDGPLSKMSVPPHKRKAVDILANNVKPEPVKTFFDDRLIFEPPAIWAGIYRRATLERYQIILPETPGAGYQDTCFSAMCFLNGLTYHWVDNHYYMYRVDREGASRHIRNRRDEIITLFRSIRHNLEHNKKLTDSAKPYFYANYFRRLIWFMQRVRVDYQFDLFLEAYRAFDDVWADKTLLTTTQALLPKGEAAQFEQFRQGRYATALLHKIMWIQSLA